MSQRKAAVLCLLWLAGACGRHDTPLASYSPVEVATTGGNSAVAGEPSVPEAGAPGDAGAGGAGGAPVVGPICPDTYTATVAGSLSRYRTVMTGQRWVNAERDCELDGAHLIVIDSAAENEWVASIAAANVTASKSTNQLAWLGATDTNTETHFRWVSGSDITLSFWNTSQPEPNGLYGDEDCVEVRGTTGEWNDDRCDAPLIYVCECDGAISAAEWCDTSQSTTCGDCRTSCPSGQTCQKQACK